MKFDSNQAWREASEAVAANREVLLALAGVFFMLPSLVFAIFMPQPQPTAGTDQAALMKMTLDYYASAAPYLIVTGVIQALGTLAMLTLFTDRSRPTVGEAIRLGAAGLLPYFGAQIMLGLAFGLVGSLLIMIAGATGVAALAGLVGALLVVALIYVMIKTSLVAPIVAVERERNPVAALKRSWQLTKGNSVRVGVFYLLVMVAFIVAITLAMLVIGVILALAFGPETARVIAAVFSSAFGAVMTLTMAAIFAAVHRQLAGSGVEDLSATFE